MASPSKVEVSSVSASVSVSGAGSAAPSKPVTSAEITSTVSAWMGDPTNKSTWNALVAISQRSGTVKVMKEDGSEKQVSVYDAVSQEFWAQYAKLPFERRETLVESSVSLIGPSTAKLHREILVTIIAREPESVKVSARNALDAIAEAEGSSGGRDREMMMLCYGALAAAQDKTCSEEGAPKDCAKESDELHRRYRKYSDHFSVGAGLGARTAMFAFGEPMSKESLGLELVVDRVDGELSPGMRLLYGGRAFVRSDMLGISGRVGGYRSLGESSTLKLALEGGYLYATGKNEDDEDVPIYPAGIVTVDGRRRERMTIESVDHTMHAASLMAAADFEYAVIGSRRGEGDAFQLNLYLGLGAGIFAGSVSDEGCTYAYTPGTPGITPLPDGNSVSVAPSAELGTRCNRGSFSTGADLRGSAGVSAVF